MLPDKILILFYDIHSLNKMPVLGNQEFTFFVETSVLIIDPDNCSGVRCETESVSGNVISYIE